MYKIPIDLRNNPKSGSAMIQFFFAMNNIVHQKNICLIPLNGSLKPIEITNGSILKTQGLIVIFPENYIHHFLPLLSKFNAFRIDSLTYSINIKTVIGDKSVINKVNRE